VDGGSEKEWHELIIDSDTEFEKGERQLDIGVGRDRDTLGDLSLSGMLRLLGC
jgi:hypothetical protein